MLAGRGDPEADNGEGVHVTAKLMASVPDAAADLVQLLTPEGERREHPDYACDLDDDAIKGLYRDLVLVPADRHRGDRAAAAG